MGQGGTQGGHCVHPTRTEAGRPVSFFWGGVSVPSVGAVALLHQRDREVFHASRVKFLFDTNVVIPAEPAFWPPLYHLTRPETDVLL